MRKQTTLSLIALLMTLSLLPDTSMAQSAKFTPTQVVFQYSAKFICGRGDGIGALSGDYLSFVNVHNPSPDKVVNFKKMFSISKYGEQAGPVTKLFDAKLKGGEAMGVECRDVYNHTGVAAGTLLEGYAVFQSPVELDVVTVYSAGSNVVQSFHTERVPARQVTVPAEIRIGQSTGQVDPGIILASTCKDMSFKLNTGGSPFSAANWMVTADASVPIDGVTTPVPYVPTKYAASVSPVYDAAMIGPSKGSSLGGKVTFGVCFCLCEFFENAQLKVTGFSGIDQATLFLNGNSLISSPLNYSGPPLLYTSNDQSLFKVGQNCLTVEVTKTPPAPNVSQYDPKTGFVLAGTVTAKSGLCP